MQNAQNAAHKLHRTTDSFRAVGGAGGGAPIKVCSKCGPELVLIGVLDFFQNEVKMRPACKWFQHRGN